MSRNPTFCPICTASHYENIENPSLRLETVFASPSATFSSRKFISHSLHRKFLILLQYLPENLQHPEQKTNKTRLSTVNFIEESLSKSLNKGNYNRVGFKKTQHFYNFFSGATESRRSLGGFNFGDILAVSVPQCQRGKVLVFWQGNFILIRLLLSGAWSLHFH